MKDQRNVRIVIIGGSAEAVALAWALPQAKVWLPHPERVARDWPRPPVVAPLTASHLAQNGTEAVLIAPHPCDSATAWAAARAAIRAGVPHAMLRRPAWRAGRGDLWHALRHERDARHVLPKGARAFITLGRDSLPGLRGLRAQGFVRRIGRSSGYPPLRQARYVPGVGPFDAREEVALLRKLRIDWLITRNAGGAGGWPKLAAARRLGLPVAMIARPHWPGGPLFLTSEEAAQWLTQRISAG